MPGTFFSADAGYACSGRRYLRQNRVRAGSSFFRSMVASDFTASSDTPHRHRKARAVFSNRSGSMPFLQPTPNDSVLGRRNSVAGKGGSISRSVMATPIRCPSSAAADTALMADGFWMAQSWAIAQLSMAGMPRTSVAVVITGAAPVFWAISRARSLAPPMWPDRMGITCRPISSMTTTAGSVALSRMSGAMARTAMPHAPMKSSASAA